MNLSTLTERQRMVATTLDRPLFVSAGAGSGKTFTLTCRIVQALSPESGPAVQGLDEVLAITFTHDAAAEIRERVRRALIAEGMAREALAVDDAWITTIHGMCARILRAHALDLGLDPEFGVAVDTDELMDRAVDNVLARGGRDFKGLLDWYPLSSSGPFGGTSARQLVRRLLELAGTARLGFDSLRFLRGTLDLSALRDAYQALWENGAGKGQEVAAIALAALDEFEQGGRTRDELVACMMACGVPRASKGFPKGSVDWLKAEAADAFLNAYLACDDAVLDQMLALSRAVFDEYVLLKRERSVLDNNDLLRLAHEALRDYPAIRREYEGRFKLVMIDEFQDTDQQQVDLIGYLAGEGGRALCTVGDAQQSIYRFRGAEVEVFRRQQRAVAAVEAAVPPDMTSGLAGALSPEVAASPFSGAPAKPDVISSKAAAPATAAPTKPGIPSGGKQLRCPDEQSAAVGPSGRSIPSATPGALVELAKNFRSHAEILSYVAQVFDGRDGGLMRDFLNLAPDEGRRDGLKAADIPRRQAFLVAGKRGEDRRAAVAAGIAARFRALADAGQPAGDMVLLLGAMSRADAYADAIRAAGLDCVISGGSVFSQMPEVKAVRALVCTLANPLDSEQGLAPLLSSPLFSLGVQEFLALATALDSETGETRRRNVEAGLLSDEDAPGFGVLPLLERARAVLRRALARVGRDAISAIARDVVNESGWFVRLAAEGAQGKAVAANVLKALDLVAEAEAAEGNSPRRVARAFDRLLLGKQAPGALNEEAGEAVRIMTVHASKGLEFPVVAVAECYGIRAGGERVQVSRRDDGTVRIAALPEVYRDARRADGTWILGADIKKQMDRFTGGSAAWLTPDMLDEVCASDSVAGAWVAMREEERRLSLEERERLLYVAMTRAREVCILAMEAPVSRGKVPELALDDTRDLTGRVLGRILPEEGEPEAAFELVALDEFFHEGELHPATEGVPREGEVAENSAVDDGAAAVPCPEEGPESGFASGEVGPGALDSFTLVEPEPVELRVVPAAPMPRCSYSYSSVAGVLHAEGEDRAVRMEVGQDADGPAPDSALSADDPTALGSAFHAAAQWLVETGSETVPPARVGIFARRWNLSAAQRERLDAALARWERSAIRAEALAWPEVRAEVPFFTLGSDELSGRFGAYAEGGIDLLCTDPDDASRALVIDYKTGGSPAETMERLREKHALQAHVYADALRKAGYRCVTLHFARVEIPDPADPSEPQLVTYRLG